jgi:hypothetical protein
LRIGVVSLTPAYRGPDFPEAGRKFIGSYAITYDVDDAAFAHWLSENADGSVVQSRAVVWAPTEDELIVVIATGRSPAPMTGAVVGSTAETTFKV